MSREEIMMAAIAKQALALTLIEQILGETHDTP